MAFTHLSRWMLVEGYGTIYIDDSESSDSEAKNVLAALSPLQAPNTSQFLLASAIKGALDSFVVSNMGRMWSYVVVHILSRQQRILHWRLRLLQTWDWRRASVRSSWKRRGAHKRAVRRSGLVTDQERRRRLE